MGKLRLYVIVFVETTKDDEEPTAEDDELKVTEDDELATEDEEFEVTEDDEFVDVTTFALSQS